MFACEMCDAMSMQELRVIVLWNDYCKVKSDLLVDCLMQWLLQGLIRVASWMLYAMVCDVLQ
jgi:hypothetical protein